MPSPAVPQRDSARPPQHAGDVRRGTTAPKRRGWTRGGLGLGAITGSLLACHAAVAAAAADPATGARPACTPRVHALSAQQVSKFFLSDEVCGLMRGAGQAAGAAVPAVPAAMAARVAAPIAVPAAAPIAAPAALPTHTAPPAVPMRDVFAAARTTASINANTTAQITERATTPTTASITAPTIIPTPPAIRRTLPQRPAPGARRAVALATDVDAVARAHDIDPLLLHAIAHVESRHNAAAVSPAGALGVMQVMPATGRRFGASHAGALHDARTNLEASAAYLKFLQRRFNSDLRLVLAGYNAGEGAVEKHGRRVPPYRETQRYVVDVLSQYERLQAVASSLAAPRGSAGSAR
jgi:soluble lytic murein transglycosylase-like protein